MKTERARELYSEYAEETLSPAMRLALEQHFAAEPDARTDYAEFERVYQLVQRHEAPLVDVPLGFRAKVLELAAEAHAAREISPAQRAAQTLTGLFANVGRRRQMTGGLVAAFAVAGLAGVFFHSVNTAPGKEGGLGPSAPITLPRGNAPTVITGVSSQPGADNNVYHMFHVHLPVGVPKATLSAFVVTATSQITNPDIRAREATPALQQPVTLTNSEEMQIPVALLKQAPAGTTLNLLVSYTPANPQLPSGTQVVFTPVSTGNASAAPDADGSSFYDALQDVAADYGVTVIADASSTPNATVADPAPNSTAQQALQNVAGQVGYSLQKLNATTYQLYPTP